MQIDVYLKSKWTKDLNIRPETLNLIEDKVEDSLELIAPGDNFLHGTPIAQAQKKKINKWDLTLLISRKFPLH